MDEYPITQEETPPSTVLPTDHYMIYPDDQEAMLNYRSTSPASPPDEQLAAAETRIAKIQEALTNRNLRPQRDKPADLAASRQSTEVGPGQEVTVRGVAVIYGGEIIKK